ncbi:hypothetical protein V6N12_037160 [Hibiscus sabdariffa]|uniref:Uncharacterized protein n=1 Tax=Hibiscus sabdariffa TaxID=183260 RepID=A0ABR1ZKV4_9ROSI
MLGETCSPACEPSHSTETSVATALESADNLVALSARAEQGTLAVASAPADVALGTEDMALNSLSTPGTKGMEPESADTDCF